MFRVYLPRAHKLASLGYAVSDFTGGFYDVCKHMFDDQILDEVCNVYVVELVKRTILTNISEKY